MSNHQLTGQERVNRMFARQDQDRVPRHETFWHDTIRRWQSEHEGISFESVWDLLETDFHTLRWINADPFPGREIILNEDEETREFMDNWGATVRYFKKRQGTPEHVAFGCETREDWDREFKPVYQSLQPKIDVEANLTALAEGRKRGRWVYFVGLEGFEATRHILGDEMTLIAMAEDPEWVEEMVRMHADGMLLNLQASWDKGIHPDGLWIYGDMAYNHATLCSPQMYKDIVWPHHKRMVDWAHAHGLKFIYHTDGDVNGVVDLYVQAGFDCLQPLEVKANMDVRNLCPKHGSELAFFGNVDVMKMITNNREVIEREIAAKINAGKETKGYVYHSDHSVPPQVSWPFYQQIIELVNKYGNY